MTDAAPSAASADAVPDEDGYEGAAQVVVDGLVDPVDVQVTLRGHFDPISGRYSWYGRVAASPDVADLVASGARAVVLRTPHAAVDTQLRDVDPWGRPRVEGFGAPPFAVLDAARDTSVPDTSGDAPA